MAFAAAMADPRVVALDQLCIHPDVRRQGIGRALLEEVEGCFPEAKTLRVTVGETNDGAIAFFRAQGFEAAGTIPADIGAAGRPALVLDKAIG
jgi:ribosomal protein S18 acetylase RimI-like enzyme